MGESYQNIAKGNDKAEVASGLLSVAIFAPINRLCARVRVKLLDHG